MTTFCQLPIRQEDSRNENHVTDRRVRAGKEHERRINREIVICDPEEAYVKRLAEALLLKREVTAGVRICSSLEMMERLLEIGQVQVLLISEDIPYEARKRAFAGKRIVLTKQHCVDLGEEETELRKYQPIDRLTADILQAFQGNPFLMPGAGREKGRILGVYSPVHRIGKTTFALKLGKVLAQKEDVLYLNLESYAGMGGYFRDNEAQDLSHFLYYAKQEQDDISVRIASLVRQMGSLDYIPPMKVWTDLKSIRAEEWKTLFEKLTVQSIYRTVLLDIGDGVEEIFSVLKLCDRILMPCAQDVYSKAKMAQYQYMLRVLKLQELEMRTIYVDMDKTMRQAVRETVETLKKQERKGRLYAESTTAS